MKSKIPHWVTALDMLHHGSITVYDLQRKMNNGPDAIKRLRDKGYVIDTELIDVYDARGKLERRYARYTLVCEPERKQQKLEV